MTLQEKVSQEIKAAMLARDADRLSTLRLLKSSICSLQIEKKVESLSDAEFVVVAQKEIKKRRDSAEQYKQGGCEELATRELAEISVLEAFLPEALSVPELEEMVRATIQELGATSKKQMGPVIKAVQAKAAGRAEGKAISEIV